jgi:hypothetical protein
MAKTRLKADSSGADNDLVFATALGTQPNRAT